jgi:hypothetical protein
MAVKGHRATSIDIERDLKLRKQDAAAGVIEFSLRFIAVRPQSKSVVFWQQAGALSMSIAHSKAPPDTAG